MAIPVAQLCQYFSVDTLNAVGRGGSRAGSLGGAQQLTGGGVVAEISFVSGSRPNSVGGGGGSSRNFPWSPEAGPILTTHSLISRDTHINQ